MAKPKEFISICTVNFVGASGGAVWIENKNKFKVNPKAFDKFMGNVARNFNKAYKDGEHIPSLTDYIFMVGNVVICDKPAILEDEWKKSTEKEIANVYKELLNTRIENEYK
jgi:translation initiation factor 6 (eIF-6)